MPIYEYEVREGGCKICGGTFTLNRPLSAPPLEKCPACKKPVRKIISGFSTPHKLKPLSVTDAKKAGFQVYKKLEKANMNGNDFIWPAPADGEIARALNIELNFDGGCQMD